MSAPRRPAGERRGPSWNRMLPFLFLISITLWHSNLPQWFACVHARCTITLFSCSCHTLRYTFQEAKACQITRCQLTFSLKSSVQPGTIVCSGSGIEQNKEGTTTPVRSGTGRAFGSRCSRGPRTFNNSAFVRPAQRSLGRPASRFPAVRSTPWESAQSVHRSGRYRVRLPVRGTQGLGTIRQGRRKTM